MYQYPKSTRNRDIKLKTLKERQTSQQMFLDRFGDKDLALIDNADGERFIHFLINEYKKPDGNVLAKRTVEKRVGEVKSLLIGQEQKD